MDTRDVRDASGVETRYAVRQNGELVHERQPRGARGQGRQHESPPVGADADDGARMARAHDAGTPTPPGSFFGDEADSDGQPPRASGPVFGASYPQGCYPTVATPAIPPIVTPHDAPAFRHPGYVLSPAHAARLFAQDGFVHADYSAPNRHPLHVGSWHAIPVYVSTQPADRVGTEATP